MRQLLLLMGVIGLAVVSCGDGPDATSSPNQLPGDSHREDAPAPHTPNVPPGVSYSVIDSDIIPGVKRSIDVRLNEKPSVDALRAIALELKAQDSNNYDRTFITYYLPGMVVGAGGWATTHFTPNLEVKILGLTEKEETALVDKAVTDKRDVVGHWIDDSAFVGSRITILRKDDKFFIEHKFKDGSGGTSEIVETQSSLGRRFDKVEGSSFGDHWVIDPAGNLQSRDNDGLITTARKTQ